MGLIGAAVLMDGDCCWCDYNYCNVRRAYISYTPVHHIKLFYSITFCDASFLQLPLHLLHKCNTDLRTDINHITSRFFFCYACAVVASR